MTPSVPAASKESRIALAVGIGTAVVVGLAHNYRRTVAQEVAVVECAAVGRALGLVQPRSTASFVAVGVEVGLPQVDTIAVEAVANMQQRLLEQGQIVHSLGDLDKKHSRRR